MPARTGQDYLNGLKATNREIWLGGEQRRQRRRAPVAARWRRGDRRLLRPAAPVSRRAADRRSRSRARRSTSATCSLARSTDLQRRHVGLARISELSMGVMGRTPDYMNVTFAGFADDRHSLGRADGSNERGLREPRRLPEAATTRRPVADAHDRPPDRRQADRRHLGEQPGAVAQGRRDGRLDHRARGSTAGHAGAVTPTSRPSTPAIRCPADAPPEYAAVVHRADGRSQAWCSCAATAACVPTSTRSTHRSPPASTSRTRCASSMTCEVPKQNVWIDGNIDVYNSVMMPSSWWPNIMQQTTIRALTKLEFAYGLATRMAEAVNDVSERTLEMLGEMQSYVEITRNAILSRRAQRQDVGGRRRLPRSPSLPSDALDPARMVPRVNEILKVIGSHNLLAAASRRQLDDPRILAADERVPARRQRHQRRGPLRGLSGGVGLRRVRCSGQPQRTVRAELPGVVEDQPHRLTPVLLSRQPSARQLPRRQAAGRRPLPRMSTPRTWALDEIQPGDPDFWTMPPADIDAALAMLRRDSPVTFHRGFYRIRPVERQVPVPVRGKPRHHPVTQHRQRARPSPGGSFPTVTPAALT